MGSLTRNSRRAGPGSRPRNRRGWRVAILLAAIVGVVCAASHLVYRGGVDALRARAEQDLLLRLRAQRDVVEDRMDETSVVLRVLSQHEQMLWILDGDVDDVIGKELRNVRSNHADLFESLVCFEPTGEIVAATDYFELGESVALSDLARRSLARSGRSWLEREGDGFSITVPAIWSEFDVPELLGYYRAQIDPAGFLSEGSAALARIVDEDGDVLAETEPTAGALARWGDPGVEVRTVPISMPAGLEGRRWSVSIGDVEGQLPLAISVLRRLVLYLTSGTAALVVGLVLVFARFEARLNRRLEERAVELEVLNEQLDRSRADLVKAARIAGMSEIATGILHNVGNVLNSVNVSADQLGKALSRVQLEDLLQLADLIDRGEEGLAAAIRNHPKGPAFAAYLSELARAMRGDHDRMVGELEGLREGVDQIKALVGSQERFARQSGVEEETTVDELVEGALVISDQVLGESPELTVLREFHPVPPLVIYKHRVMEILVNLVNNARQAMREAAIDAPTLTVRALCDEERRLRIEVQDNGVGIPAENLVQIFNHGFSTREGGHGFGLHASVNAASELGGELTGHSDGPGTGATFALALPFDAARPGAAAA